MMTPAGNSEDRIPRPTGVQSHPVAASSTRDRAGRLRVKHRAAWAGVVAITVLGMAGCSQPGGLGGAPAGGAGLPPRASKADYQAAFADIDPIQLRVQTLDAQTPDADINAFVETVEEWSNGKITFEVGYSASFAPDALRFHSALASGQVDISPVIPSYTPQIFPDMNALATASIIGSQGSNHSLAAPAWMSEEAFNNDKIMETFKTEGIYPLLPSSPDHSPTTIFCTSEIQSAGDLKGKLIAVAGTGKVAVTTALGMEPVSLPFAEQYEALERGIIDCAASGPLSVALSGTKELVPYVLMDDRVGLPQQYTGLYISLEKWERLPLVAQQLLWDSLDEYLVAHAKGNMKKSVPVIAAMKSVAPYDDTAVQIIKSANAKLVDGLASEGYDVDRYEERSKAWSEKVGGILTDTSFYDYAINNDWSSVDLSEFGDLFYEDVLLPRRPQ